jgi:hypothetical protein
MVGQESQPPSKCTSNTSGADPPAQARDLHGHMRNATQRAATGGGSDWWRHTARARGWITGCRAASAGSSASLHSLFAGLLGFQHARSARPLIATAPRSVGWGGGACMPHHPPYGRPRPPTHVSRLSGACTRKRGSGPLPIPDAPAPRTRTPRHPQDSACGSARQRRAVCAAPHPIPRHNLKNPSSPELEHPVTHYNSSPLRALSAPRAGGPVRPPGAFPNKILTTHMMIWVKSWFQVRGAFPGGVRPGPRGAVGGAPRLRRPIKQSLPGRPPRSERARPTVGRFRSERAPPLLADHPVAPPLCISDGILTGLGPEPAFALIAEVREVAGAGPGQGVAHHRSGAAAGGWGWGF